MTDCDPPILEITDYDGGVVLVTVDSVCECRESEFGDEPAWTRGQLLAGKTVLTVAGTYRLATAEEIAAIRNAPEKPWRMVIDGPFQPSDRTIKRKLACE